MTTQLQAKIVNTIGRTASINESQYLYNRLRDYIDRSYDYATYDEVESMLDDVFSNTSEETPPEGEYVATDAENDEMIEDIMSGMIIADDSSGDAEVDEMLSEIFGS